MPPETPAPLLAFWLIPVEPHRSRLAEVIHALAEKYDAPAFDPHVTIYATHAREFDKSHFEQAIRHVQSITLRVVRVAFSDQFTKTLFIEFAASKTLTSLCASLRSLDANPSDYTLEPHLSLLYKAMPGSQKSALAESTVIPFSEIPFDRIQVVTGNDVVLTRITPTAWQIWQSDNFGTNANNPLIAGDLADNDTDGVANLMEYATKMNPALIDLVPQSATKNGSVLDFIFTKNKAATDVTYIVEWSDTLNGTDWNIVGVTQSLVPGSDNGVTQQIKATISAGSTFARRFVRLKVTRP